MAVTSYQGFYFLDLGKFFEVQTVALVTDIGVVLGQKKDCAKVHLLML